MLYSLLHNPVFLIFGGSFGVAITAILASAYQRIRRDELEAQLKADMLERGLSPDQIRDVLEAHMGDGAAKAVRRAARRYAD